MTHKFSRDESRRGGQASGKTRREKAREAHGLPLEDVNAMLSFETAEDVKAALEQICKWSAAGLINGSAGNACVGAAREWVKANQLVLDTERLKAAERRIKELEAELATRRQPQLRSVK